MRAAWFLIGLLAGQACLALDLNGTRYLKLGTVAGRLGMRTEWIEKPGKIRLYSEWTRLTFAVDQREFQINGRRIHLGFPVAEHRGSLYLSESDFRNQIQPVLTPQVFGVPPDIRRIVLDPGHGGGDPGARNEELGLIEKALVLDLAGRLKARLEAAGYSVSLTRTRDRFLPLEKRAAIANSRKADLFLSLHFNAHRRAEVAGAETYVLTPDSQPSTSGNAAPETGTAALPGNDHDPWNSLLGFYLQRALLDELGSADRGLKRARFAVLRDLRMPGILIEAGFVSNPVEGRNIGSAAYRDRIADAIVEGLRVYRKTRLRLDTPSP